MPIMRKSPWAKLTMFMTPQIRVSPMAISEYTKPISRPLTSCCNQLFGHGLPLSRKLAGGGAARSAPPAS